MCRSDGRLLSSMVTVDYIKRGRGAAQNTVRPNTRDCEALA